MIFYLEAGICKCGKVLKFGYTPSYNLNNFEGDVLCRECQRLYHIEIKKGIIKLGRCHKIFRINLVKNPRLLVPRHYRLGQGVGQNYQVALHQSEVR